MIQVRTFDREVELNRFLETVPEENVIKIEWKLFSSLEDHSEYFLLQYRSE